ncbi:MAG TPA: cyanophycin synthetase [Solirubrobacteraceae bacterium]|nr:cyanophycin synthetase [Solirubrobacteraceae bacterium]
MSEAHGGSWSGERAERHLRSLELFGMRFGLDRMRRMMTVLGSPERRFASIHVVGTNGKSSTTRMIAAILQRHGLSTGAYLSPHLVSYAERVQVAERDMPMHAFAAAVARAAWAAERVNRTLAEDDHVTQFELLTAAAFWALAERGVDVAAVEAGLGGRYDATSVIESSVAVLTNVGLEHTRWLGPKVSDIAAEKLAVVPAGGTLALGADLHPDALAVARAVAAERDARIVLAPASDGAIDPARGAFQQRNFALARVAAEVYLRSVGIAPDERAVRAAAQATAVPGRVQVLALDPLTILDGAHNPDAAAALVQSLGQLPGAAGLGEGRPLALVMGVLEDKDAAGMLARLLPLCTRAWFTAPPSSRALSPAALQSLARQQGFAEALCEPDPSRALAQAQAWARGERDAAAAVLATGSVYLVGELLAAANDGAQDAGAAAR